MFTEEGKCTRVRFCLNSGAGKYFFWNPISGDRSWLPKEWLLSHLRTAFTATRREMLFDPFCEEEVFIDDKGNESDGIDESIREVEERPQRSIQELEEDFIKLLLEREVDAFASWPAITALLGGEPAFQAITSDKRRQELLSQCCPQLIASKKAKKEAELRAAMEWFEGEVAVLVERNVHWMDALRRLKGDPRFGLLNLKESEQFYKNQQKHRK